MQLCQPEPECTAPLAIQMLWLLQSGAASHLFFRGVDQSAPATQAAMLSALNATLHTKDVNATLSAFAGNWCAAPALLL